MSTAELLSTYLSSVCDPVASACHIHCMKCLARPNVLAKQVSSATFLISLHRNVGKSEEEFWGSYFVR